MTDKNLVHQNGEKLFVTSLEISNRFGKQHKNVLRDIETLGCSPEFRRLNFEPISYNDGHQRLQRAFNITRDGFVFLCMGFTGPQAALWKERYITAFNEMETALRAPAIPADPLAIPSIRLILDANRDMSREVGQLKDTVAAQNQAILALYQRIDTAQRGHIRAVTSLLSLQKRQASANAKALVIELNANGVSREEISRRSGKTLNHVRQIIFQAHQASAAQGELSLEGGAA